MNRQPHLVIGVAFCLLAAPGCGRREAAVEAGGRMQLQFWHTRRGPQEKLLQTLCADYEKQNPGVDVVPSYQGTYDELNKKVRGAIQAKSLPAMAVGYESQVVEYMANGAVRPLDELLKTPKLGLSPQELADIPAPYLASNRFKQYGNQLLSFPFTKSNLVMYFNRTLLQKAGFPGPPKTWPEFEKQAAAVTRQIKQPAFVFDVDASTLDGMIFSQGGEVVSPDGKQTLFDRPPAVKAFELLQRMARAKTLREATGDEVGALFAGQRCALYFGTSAGRANMEGLVQGKFDWDLAILPHAEGAKPATVMYGPNVCLFKSNPQQEREAWKFVKWFVSPPVTARWARETGYLPIRKSAVSLPEMKAFYAKEPRAWHVYQVLPMAKPEPNVVGWQEVRAELEKAARSVLGGGTPPASAAAELKRKADLTLARSR